MNRTGKFKGMLNGFKIKSEIEKNQDSTFDLDFSNWEFHESLSYEKIPGSKWNECNLRGASFKKTDFQGSEFFNTDFGPLLEEKEDGSERPPEIQERTNLEGADLSFAYLQGSNLEYAWLVDAKLESAFLNPLTSEGEEIPTNLSNADLSRANLSKADLRKAIFQNANLKQANLTDALLEGADFTGANLSGVTWTNSTLQRESLGERILQEEQQEYLVAKQIYLALKKHFDDIGDASAASWAYIRERTMERNSFFPTWVKKNDRAIFDKEVTHNPSRLPKRWLIIKFYARFFWKWLKSALVWIFMGYGERPENALYFALASITIFSFLHLGAGGLVHGSDPMQAVTFLDCFLHSLGSFTTMPYLDPSTTLSSVLTSLEGITGVIALAIFTSALAQRIGSR